MGTMCYIGSWTLVHSRDVYKLLWLAGMADAIHGHLGNVSKEWLLTSWYWDGRGKLAWLVPLLQCRKLPAMWRIDGERLMTIIAEIVGGERRFDR